MSLSTEDVKRIAYLARVEVSEQEAAALLPQLSNILNLVEQMQAVNTEGIEPMSHAQDVSLRTREDKVTEQDRHQAFQVVAPKVERGLYLVPKVID